MKTQQHDTTGSMPAQFVRYEAPTLTLVGAAAEVVLGIAGGGFDGDFGMSEPMFEFEPDGAPID